MVTSYPLDHIRVFRLDPSADHDLMFVQTVISFINLLISSCCISICDLVVIFYSNPKINYVDI